MFKYCSTFWFVVIALIIGDYQIVDVNGNFQTPFLKFKFIGIYIFGLFLNISCLDTSQDEISELYI